jgi:uncharacterized protein
MSDSRTGSSGIVRGYFKNRALIVTGASSGIGHDVALAFGSQGAKVALLARRAAPMEELAARIIKHGGKALALQCDVTDRSRVFAAVEQVRDSFGAVDILVNAAGLLISDPVEQMRPEDLERMMAVNLFGAINTMQAVLPAMRRRGGGNIVNVGSLAGRRGVSPLGGYSATKFALVGLTDALRVELFGSGIRVSLVMPGVIQTPMYDEARRSDSLKGLPTVGAMPARWVTWAVLAAAAFGLTEVGVPPGAAVTEKLATLFPGLTDVMLSVGDRVLREVTRLVGAADSSESAPARPHDKAQTHPSQEGKRKQKSPT